MRNYRPLVLQRLDVSLPGLRVLRLRLNRHLPEADGLEPHSHTHEQMLCYLGGSGVLRWGRSARMEAVAGSVAVIPRRVRHGFVEGAGRRPLCLALDVEMAGVRRVRTGRMSAMQAAGVRRALARLVRLEEPSSGKFRLVSAAAALEILDIVLRVAGMLPKGSSAPVPAAVRRFLAAVRDPELPMEEAVQRAGCQRDYLNRLVRKFTGLTLGQHRDAARLDSARRSLAGGATVVEAALASGFEDANYFARWFRKQTGAAPSRWRIGKAGGRGGNHFKAKARDGRRDHRAKRNFFRSAG